MNKGVAVLCLFAVAFCLLVISSPVLAVSMEEKSYLTLYFSDDELTVESATRSEQLVSRTAENIAVVTAADIERMNAHTLADVLNTIPGVEVWSNMAPGQQATVTILGSDSPHVTVIMDGVPRNYLWSQFAEVGMIPVQDIEKVEVIKGAASSVWGSALGGVINIITKSGRQLDQGVVLSGSYGNKTFADLRAEARGKQDGFGYYLSAGRLQSGALAPNTSTAENNVYSKFSYDLSSKTEIQAVVDYERTDRDGGAYVSPPLLLGDISQHMHWTLTANSSFAANLELNISAWSYNQYQKNFATDLTAGLTSELNKEQNKGEGIRAKLTWKSDIQTVVVGADADSKTDEIVYIAGGSQTIRDQAIYANDTIALNRFTIIPGIRYDNTNSNGDFWSPSLGLMYRFAKDTTVRAFVARGFNIPSPADTSGTAFWIANPDLKMETAWSYQAGAETAAWKPLWLKLTLFRSDLHDKINWVQLPSGEMQVQNVNRARREGMLVEARTAPVFNTSLAAGAEFITSEDLDTGQHLPGIPTQVYDIAVRYDDKQSFNAILVGRHINWNPLDVYVSKYHSMLLDLTASKKVYERWAAALEVFASAHNLLNTQQYSSDTYPNASRWYEAGVRCKF